MEKPNVLLIPFRFREGYPEDLVTSQVKTAVKLLTEELKFTVTQTEQIVTDNDAEALKREYPAGRFDFVILLIPTWIEAPLVVRALMPFRELPVVLWGYGSFEHNSKRVTMGALAGSGVSKGSLMELGIPHLYLYGYPEKPEHRKRISKKLELFARVARAQTRMNSARIGVVGYVFGGMHTGSIDHMGLRTQFGPDLVHIDTYSLLSKVDTIDTGSKDFAASKDEINALCTSPMNHEADRITTLYMGLKSICREKDLDALTVKCHFELSQEYGLTACIPLSVLGNSIVASCESDLPLVTTQLLMHYLSGGTITTYGDVHDLEAGKALIAACGFAPAGMCLDDKIAIESLAGDSAQGLGATFGGYITNSSFLKEGEVTLARILKREGQFCLHYVLGEALGDIGEVRELDCPRYPCTEVKLSADMDEFAQNMGSHHYAVIYGDLSKELEHYSRLTGIKTIKG